MLVKKRPDLWGKPKMQELCALTCGIAGNPNLFPLTKNNKWWGIRIDQLTKGIDSLLFNRGMHIRFNTDKIILCISHAENVTESNFVTELGTAATNMRRWKYVPIDGDNKHITIQVNSTLSSAGNILIPGVVSLISKSIQIFWNYEDRSDDTCAIVVQEFKIVGQHPVPDESLVNQHKKSILSLLMRRKMFLVKEEATHRCRG